MLYTFTKRPFLLRKTKSSCVDPVGFFSHSARHFFLNFVSHFSARSFISSVIRSAIPTASLKSSHSCRALNSAFRRYFQFLRFIASPLMVRPAFDFLAVQVSPQFFFTSPLNRPALPQMLTAKKQCAEVVRPARKNGFIVLSTATVPCKRKNVFHKRLFSACFLAVRISALWAGRFRGDVKRAVLRSEAKKRTAQRPQANSFTRLRFKGPLRGVKRAFCGVGIKGLSVCCLRRVVVLLSRPCGAAGRARSCQRTAPRRRRALNLS